MTTAHLEACDDYLAARTGRYEWRAVRYREAAHLMRACGLTNDMTVTDIGAGWTEFDYCLRTEFDWRGRYIPVDGAMDGTNLESWVPRRMTSWSVGLEIIEHLDDPERLVTHLQRVSTKGVVLSTPNPRTTDVLGMDATHKTPVSMHDLAMWGFGVAERSFYGQPADSLFAWWQR